MDSVLKLLKNIGFSYIVHWYNKPGGKTISWINFKCNNGMLHHILEKAKCWYLSHSILTVLPKQIANHLRNLPVAKHILYFVCSVSYCTTFYFSVWNYETYKTHKVGAVLEYFTTHNSVNVIIWQTNLQQRR